MTITSKIAAAAGKTENHGVAENRIFAGILSHCGVARELTTNGTTQFDRKKKS